MKIKNGSLILIKSYTQPNEMNTEQIEIDLPLATTYCFPESVDCGTRKMVFLTDSQVKY